MSPRAFVAGPTGLVFHGCPFQSPDHPGTLTTRHNGHRDLDGQCGDATGALRLFRELLPDFERIFGPAHPSTLTTRNAIAYWARMLPEKGGQ